MASVGGSMSNCCLVDQYKYALYRRFREPKLYRYAAQGEWDLIPQRCKTHAKEAKFVHKYAPQDTALHKVIRMAVPKEQSPTEEARSIRLEVMGMKLTAVRALLQANPAAASTSDSFRRTPLHWACMDVAGNFSNLGTTQCIFWMLLTAAPHVTKLQDIERRMPLHYLLSRNKNDLGHIPFALLEKIISLNPDALTQQDEVGETPMDIALSRCNEEAEGRDDDDNGSNEFIEALRQLQAKYCADT